MLVIHVSWHLNICKYCQPASFDSKNEFYQAKWHSNITMFGIFLEADKHLISLIRLSYAILLYVVCNMIRHIRRFKETMTGDKCFLAVQMSDELCMMSDLTLDQTSERCLFCSWVECKESLYPSKRFTTCELYCPPIWSLITFFFFLDNLFFW